MVATKDRLERDFVCPKCHARGAVAHEVSLGRVVAGVFPLPSSRHMAVSCGLCGFTEIYNMAIVEKLGEREGADVAAPTEPAAIPRQE